MYTSSIWGSFRSNRVLGIFSRNLTGNDNKCNCSVKTLQYFWCRSYLLTKNDFYLLFWHLHQLVIAWTQFVIETFFCQLCMQIETVDCKMKRQKEAQIMQKNALRLYDGIHSNTNNLRYRIDYWMERRKPYAFYAKRWWKRHYHEYCIDSDHTFRNASFNVFNRIRIQAHVQPGNWVENKEISRKMKSWSQFIQRMFAFVLRQFCSFFIRSHHWRIDG